MVARLSPLLLALLCTLVAPAAAHAATPPVGPDGAAFYQPPAELVPGPEGSIIWARPATGLADVPSAARTTLVLYRSQGVTGAPVAISGTVVTPKGTPPAGGWPIAAWGHVTTGGGDVCGPSTILPGDPEQRRKLGDAAITRRLLANGIAVVRSDFEGINTPGPHPYLIGRSLARSTINMVRAGRALEPQFASRWLAVGHSEGGAASMWSGEFGPKLAPELELRGVAALTPPVTTRESIELGQLIPARIPGLNVLNGLGALVLSGVGAAHPEVDALYRAGGLSPAALSLFPDLDTRCLTTLGHGDSWGRLAPARIAGPRLAELKRVVYPILDANNPANADVGDLPIRIDAGDLDLITPSQTIVNAVRGMRRRGANVTLKRHPFSNHPSIVKDARPVADVTAWVTARLRG